ncbi:MAG: DNA recombination protein RmuC, partial [Halofilum sp. (in: g-proteobacteria)]|nr:DNA recombination protein RmuC [Halofilum sp. (in: g-proteobacteria)]
MVDHCDFEEQQTMAAADGGSTRPDMVVHMPEGREIVVDAKTPLDAYVSATQSAEPEERQRQLERFARHVKEKVRELAAKSYWTQFSRSPEFVVLFIPGEQFLGAALDIHPELQEEALRQKVVLATPNNLVALLKTIAFGWRQQAVAENAERLRQEGTELYNRVVTFTGHLGRLGKNLRQSVESYNQAIGSLEHKLLPGARRFTEMGIQPRKTLEDPEQVDVTTRELPRTGDPDPAAGDDSD